MISVLQFLNEGTPVTTGALTGVTAGSTIVVFSISCYISDDQNGSYGSPLATVSAAGQSWEVRAFVNSAGGTLNFTCTPYGASCSFLMLEVGGARTSAYTATTTAVDSSPGTGTDAQTTAAITPTGVPGMFLAYGADSSTFSAAPAAGTGFTSYGLFTDAGYGPLARVEYLRVTAATALPITFTATNGGGDSVTLGIFLEEFVVPPPVTTIAAPWISSF